MISEIPLATIETLTAQIRDTYPDMLIDLRGRREAGRWAGYARVGLPKGQCPVWQAYGPTKAAAIAAALSHAHSYWLNDKDGG